MIEAPAHDLLPVLEKDKNVEIVVPDTLGLTYVLRFNWKQPPFNDVRYRRAAALCAQPEGLPAGRHRRSALLQGLQGDVRLRHAARDLGRHGGHAGVATSRSRRSS